MSPGGHAADSLKALMCLSRSAKLILWAIFGIASIVAYILYGKKTAGELSSRHKQNPYYRRKRYERLSLAFTMGSYHYLLGFGDGDFGRYGGHLGVFLCNLYVFN